MLTISEERASVWPAAGPIGVAAVGPKRRVERIFTGPAGHVLAGGRDGLWLGTAEGAASTLAAVGLTGPDGAALPREARLPLSVAWTRDGSVAYALTLDGVLRLPLTGETSPTYLPDTEPFPPLALAPDGRRIARRGDGPIHIVPLLPDSGIAPTTIPAPDRMLNESSQAIWSPDGRALAVDGAGAWWRCTVADRQCTRSAIGAPEAQALPITFTADGRSLVVAVEPHLYRVPADGSGPPLRIFSIPSGTSLTPSPDGRWIIAHEGGADRVSVLDVERPGEPLVIRSPDGTIESAAMSADGEALWLVTAGQGGRARIWTVLLGRALVDAVERATTACLSYRTRVDELSDGPREACAAARACAARFGRPPPACPEASRPSQGHDSGIDPYAALRRLQGRRAATRARIDALAGEVEALRRLLDGPDAGAPKGADGGR